MKDFNPRRPAWEADIRTLSRMLFHAGTELLPQAKIHGILYPALKIYKTLSPLTNWHSRTFINRPKLTFATTFCKFLL